jgi:DUF4097 and DUF4098 domain-containing protein YvlB
MKNKLFVSILTILIATYFLVGAASAVEKKEIVKTFKGVTALDIHTVSGDCMIGTTSGDTVTVTLIHTYDEDCFEPEFEKEGSTLSLREYFHGSCSGRSLWKILVPAKTDVEFKSASGDFEASGLQGKLEAATASGDFELKKIKGDVEIKSASGDLELTDMVGDLEVKTASGDFEISEVRGDIKISTASGDIEADDLKGDTIVIKGASSDIEVSNAAGRLEVKTASGDLEIHGIEITGPSMFKTASGDVAVELGKSAAFDLTVATASGDATLSYNGNPIKGYFEFTAKVDDGRIVSPIAFDKEEKVMRYGQEYWKKSFSKGGQTPKIVIKTASGVAKLKE